MAVLENDGSRAVAEPVSVTTAKSYQFSATGTHTVYVKFVDSSRLYNLFSAVNRLKQNIIHLRWSNLVRSISPELYYDFLNNRSAYDMAAGYIEEAERSLD